MKNKIACAATWLLITIVPGTIGHSWIEDIFRISSKGAFEGSAGYARGNVPRDNNPGPDIVMVNRILANDTKIPMCGPKQQIGSQTPGFPVLQASQGDMIALRYAENGHVTKLEGGRPAHGGTVYIYGTSKPSNSDTYLGIHHQWNADGTGGDRRGILIATRPYDDGQCYQKNSASGISNDRQDEFPIPGNGDLLCQNDIKIPDDATSDYTLYWVWEWPLVASNGKQLSVETYTQCIDLKVTKKSQNSAKSQGIKVEKGQPFQSVALSQQLSKAFLIDPNLPQQPGPIPEGVNSPPAGAASPLTLPPLPNVAQPSATAAKPSNDQPVLSSALVAQPSPTPPSPQASSPPAPKPTVSGGRGSNPEAGGNGFVTVTVTNTPPAVTVTETKLAPATSQPTVQIPDGGSKVVLPTKPNKPVVTKTNTVATPLLTVTITPSAVSAQKPTSVATGSPAQNTAPGADAILPIPPKKTTAGSSSPEPSTSPVAATNPSRASSAPPAQNSTLQARQLHSRHFRRHR